MDKIRTVIELLDEEDRKAFGLFIQRQKKLKGRMDLSLYKLLSVEPPLKREQILKKLYQDQPNPAAYHALRKRLMQHLSAFILLKRTDEDKTAYSKIMGTVSLAAFLFEKGEGRLAWEFIKKAEKTALEAEQHALLNNIYLIQAEYAASEHAPKLDDILAKHRFNQQAAKQTENLTFAKTEIRLKLLDAMQSGAGIDFDAVVKKILEKYGLSRQVQQSPGMLYGLMEISRNAVLVKKDFYDFEPFVIRQYQTIVSRGGFAQHQTQIKMGFLYMIAHVLYRNRKFEGSLAYLEELESEIAANKKSFQAHFYPKTILLKAANHSFLGDNLSAARILEAFIKAKPSKADIQSLFNAQLNLSFYYFQGGMFDKACSAFYAPAKSDRFLEKQMGREWVLKRGISEIILQYELGNWDIAENRLRALRRGFKKLLRTSLYANADTFLKLLHELLKNPDAVRQSGFMEKVENELSFAPIEREDLQAMNFYAWLKSKMLKKSYAEVLGELVGQ